MKALPPDIEAELKEAGVAYELRKGSNHRKLFVDGRLVTVVPYGSGEGNRRSLLNMKACIRRAIRGQGVQP